MRRTLWLGALLLGACLCGAAQAQVTTTSTGTGSFVVTRVPTQTQQVQPSSSLSDSFLGMFRLNNVFTSISSWWTSAPQPSVTRTIPDPSSPDYLKAFGYQRFR